MIQDVNLLEELFYSSSVWGYLGPVAFVTIGYFVAKKNEALGLLWYVVCLLMSATYIGLLGITPNYIWNVLILVFGGGVACITPILD